MNRKKKNAVESDSDSEVEYLSKKLHNLKIANEKRDINILLLGETGVGKSTFINAFFNYLQYPTLKKARKGHFVTLIPTRFTITDENYEERVIRVGEDTNELVEIGVSATQSCRSYVYPIEGGRLRIRLIDTPGIGDTRGINQDNINFENILSFIGEMKQLNAICILLKPNNSRLTVMFEFCIKQLLSRLEKSASRNLIFIFTNTRSTFYRPGETMPALKKLLATIDGARIPLDKENIFCTDNEAFRFVAAVNNGVRFSTIDVDNFSQSWIKSVQECWRMITYITGDSKNVALEPHDVKNTISVNEARRLIVQLSQPLADIAQLILDNIQALERHKFFLNQDNNSLTELKTKLYIPCINLRVIAMDQPTTVCTSPKCSTIYTVGDKQKWHYHQKCHCPCYLTNVPKEIVGAPELTKCAAMNALGVCKKCSCRFQVHMHIYYETETYEDRIEDNSIKTVIMDKELALIQSKNLIKKISARINEYKQEKEIIMKITAKFACFLKMNAITPYNDAYQAYLEYLIDRERSLGDLADYQMIRQFQKMLAEYTEEKNVLAHALNHSSSNVRSITADDVINSVKTLYNLKYNGEKIKQMILMQKRAREDENQSEIKEYIYKALCKTDLGSKGREKQTEINQYKQNTQSNVRGFGRPNQYQHQYSRNTTNIRNQPAPIPQTQQRNSAEVSYSQEANSGAYLHIKQHSAGNFDIQIGQTDRPSNQPNYPHRRGGPTSSRQYQPNPRNQYFGPNMNRYPRENPPPYSNVPPPHSYYQNPPPHPQHTPPYDYYTHSNYPPPLLQPPHVPNPHFARQPHQPNQQNQNRFNRHSKPTFNKNPNRNSDGNREYNSEPVYERRSKSKQRHRNKKKNKETSTKFHNLDNSSSDSDSDDSKYLSATGGRH